MDGNSSTFSSLAGLSVACLSYDKRMKAGIPDHGAFYLDTSPTESEMDEKIRLVGDWIYVNSVTKEIDARRMNNKPPLTFQDLEKCKKIIFDTLKYFFQTMPTLEFMRMDESAIIEHIKEYQLVLIIQNMLQKKTKEHSPRTTAAAEIMAGIYFGLFDSSLDLSPRAQGLYDYLQNPGSDLEREEEDVVSYVQNSGSDLEREEEDVVSYVQNSGFGLQETASEPQVYFCLPSSNARYSSPRRSPSKAGKKKNIRPPLTHSRKGLPKVHSVKPETSSSIGSSETYSSSGRLIRKTRGVPLSMLDPNIAARKVGPSFTSDGYSLDN
jgi:hypothetical protein